MHYAFSRIWLWNSIRISAGFLAKGNRQHELLESETTGLLIQWESSMNTVLVLECGCTSEAINRWTRSTL